MSGGGFPIARLASTDPEWVGEPRKGVPAGYAADAFRRLLILAERHEWDREGLEDTPARAARAWAELTCGYHQHPADLFTTFDSDGYDELVMVRSIPFHSLCEHHLLPFTGTAAVAYIAKGRIVGLSKLARLVNVFARRLQTQERLTMQVADAVETYLEPAAVMVVVKARHLCMEMRGVQAHGAETVTNDVRGLFKHAPQARAEALALLHD